MIAHENGDRRGEAYALGNMGNAYSQLGDARRAIGYFDEQKEITREIGDRHEEGNALANLGNAYNNLGDARQGMRYHEQAINIHREIGDRRGEGISLANLGNVYHNLGDTRRAIEYYEKALVIVREIDDLRSLALVSFSMALLYALQDEPALALPLAQEAAEGFTRIGFPEMTQRAQQLVAQLLGSNASASTQTDSENPAQAAFEAFQHANNPQAMSKVLAQYPLMANPDFIEILEEIIEEQVPPEDRPQFEQRLAWLKESIQS